MSNYATKPVLKNATGLEKPQFANKDHLANLKTEADKLDIDKLAKLEAKLEPVPVTLKI